MLKRADHISPVDFLMQSPLQARHDTAINAENPKQSQITPIAKENEGEKKLVLKNILPCSAMNKNNPHHSSFLQRQNPSYQFTPPQSL
jgi:hypothetical protein